MSARVLPLARFPQKHVSLRVTPSRACTRGMLALRRLGSEQSWEQNVRTFRAEPQAHRRLGAFGDEKPCAEQLAQRRAGRPLRTTRDSSCLAAREFAATQYFSRYGCRIVTEAQ